MQNTGEKYPILTAWLGFTAIMSVGALILGLVFMRVGTLVNTILQLIFTFLGGYFVAKLMIEHHILSQFEGPPIIDEVSKTLSQRLPLLATWISFLALSILPTMAIQWIANLFPYPFAFLINFILAIIVGYFIFAFAANKFVVSLYSTFTLR